MVGLAAHWMVGSIFSAGVGWAVIPAAPDAWRLFLVVASLPAWCAALGAWLMPESPRHLLVTGQTAAAEQVCARACVRACVCVWRVCREHCTGALAAGAVVSGLLLRTRANAAGAHAHTRARARDCSQQQLPRRPQVLARMARINGTKLARPIRLQPHQSSHLLLPPRVLATPPPDGAPADAAVRSHAGGVATQSAAAAAAAGRQQAGARGTCSADGASSSSSGASGHAVDMSWHHARGHYSQPSGACNDDNSLLVAQSVSQTAQYRPQRYRGGAGYAAAATADDEDAVGSAGGRGSGQQEHARVKQQQRQRCCRSGWATAALLLQPPLRQRFLPLLVAWLGLCGGWYSTVLWIPEFFKARGAQSASLYAEAFAVAAANLPGV
jgi:hypothetical protein